MLDSEAARLITLFTAVLGAVLGLLNAWRAFNQDRVRVRVRASFAIFDTGDLHVVVEVVNLSTFPITITGLGFTLPDGWKMPLTSMMLLEAEQLPRRLEARTSLTAVPLLAAYQSEAFWRAEQAYACTACGVERRSSRNSLAIAKDNLARASKARR